MIFVNRTYERFLECIKGKRIVQFGVSSLWDYYMQVFPGIIGDVVDSTCFIVDNDPNKQGKKVEISDRNLEVKAPYALNGIGDCVILIAVTFAYQRQICEQLQCLSLAEDVECYSLHLMIYSDKPADNSSVSSYFFGRKEIKIPKKIHSFWFSEEEKPEIYERCIKSWVKHCPGFEIVEWNSKNYDISQNQYMKEAFENKKWAFVSDYARLDVIVKYGGVYVDMDVELLASLENYLYADGFFCRQEDGMLELGSGFGAQPNDEIICALLKAYEYRTLILDGGKIDMTPQPSFLSGVFDAYGLSRCHDSKIVRNRIVLSNDYIQCGSEGNLDVKAILGIHWHNGGWLSAKKRKLMKESLNVRQGLIQDFFSNHADNCSTYHL